MVQETCTLLRIYFLIRVQLENVQYELCNVSQIRLFTLMYPCMFLLAAFCLYYLGVFVV
jgi:hypothetical protein